MEPVYSDGDIVVIDPARVPKPGDAVVLWKPGGGACEARELIEKSSDAVRTGKAPLIRKIVGVERLAAMHVIVGTLKPAETTVQSARHHEAGDFMASIGLASGRGDEHALVAVALAQARHIWEPPTDLESADRRAVLMLYPNFRAATLRQEWPLYLGRRRNEET